MLKAKIEQMEANSYRDSVKQDSSKLTAWLLENVGQRITATALGLSDASILRRENAALRGDREDRLRLLFRVARIVAGAFDAETARAFLVSSNPQLGDKSPLMVISDQKPSLARPKILGAARALFKSQ